MKRLFNCADRYIQARGWKMLAILKFCMCAIGILLGLLIPAGWKKTVAIIAAAVFLITYILLMTDFLGFARKHFRSKA